MEGSVGFVFLSEMLNSFTGLHFFMASLFAIGYFFVCFNFFIPLIVVFVSGIYAGDTFEKLKVMKVIKAIGAIILVFTLVFFIILLSTGVLEYQNELQILFIVIGPAIIIFVVFVFLLLAVSFVWKYIIVPIKELPKLFKK